MVIQSIWTLHTTVGLSFVTCIIMIGRSNQKMGMIYNKTWVSYGV